MKKLLRVLGWTVLVALVLIVFALAYSTAKGHVAWFFRLDGVVVVDGKMSGGYLHANTNRTILLVTRTDTGRPETYLVPAGDNLMIVDCGDWHPIRFLPTPIGDVNPPCFGYDIPARFADAPTSRTRVTSRRSVEFTTSSGKTIKAEW